jgi:hypothetical protein
MKDITMYRNSVESYGEWGNETHGFTKRWGIMSYISVRSGVFQVWKGKNRIATDIRRHVSRE